MTTPLNISLPETLRAYVEERVARGGFADAGDYLRALIREDCARQAKVQLEQLLLEGLASGEPIEATEQYWDNLKFEVEQRIRQDRADA